METKAAILVELNRPLELVDLTIPPLRAGQVLVELAYSGVCHTQLLEVRGYRGPDPFLPHGLGHEASGRVVELGAEVTKVRVGDRVICSWMKGSGANVPGCQYRWQNKTVNAGGITTFQQYAVISENRLVRLPDTIDDRIAALLGCAIPTGVGAVRNTARIHAGQSVAVFGTGGVGLCAVAAAALAGASPLIAVDLHPQRLELAQRLGANLLLNPTESDPREAIRQQLPSGLDWAIEASGRPQVMELALSCVRDRGGSVVVVGNARAGEKLQIDPRELNQGKRLLGTWGGDNEPDQDFPQYGEWIASGKLNVRPLVEQIYSLDQINLALADLETARVARPLILTSPSLNG